MGSNKLIKIILSVVLLAGFILPVFNYFDWQALAQTSQQEREALEQELKQLEEQLSNIENDIEKTEKEKKTLQTEIYLLKRRIQSLNVQIQQSNTMIKDLGYQIEDTEGSIETTIFKVEESKDYLSAILRSIHQEDKKSLIEIFLSENDLSDFFENMIALETLNGKSRELLADIKNLKLSLEDQKESLDEEKIDLETIVKVRLLQRQESSVLKNQQEGYLELTEEQYQVQLQEKQETEKKANEIRARIFELIGVPKAPTFGEAYEIAKYVTSITGIRPALVLAVLTQESNIGKNVGQCYLTDTTTGRGKRITTGKIELKTMNPTRDLPYFLEITRKLGRDPLSTPVSCPMSIGWGGAMGPAQFIPDTWGNPRYGYGEKVKQVTGREANPWDIRDAFLASGIYLKDLGAKTNEFKAVMRYFSGYRWSKWEEFYGRSVLAIADRYEEDIKELGN
ncbi:MAG: lytic murein transglycosylase [Patescibacteria group bacterium]|nr:lytic murein transglycosylase [Patescibacteria group bacterium]